MAQLESYQDRREARLADLRRGGGRLPDGGGHRSAAAAPLPLPPMTLGASAIAVPPARQQHGTAAGLVTLSPDPALTRGSGNVSRDGPLPAASNVPVTVPAAVWMAAPEADAARAREHEIHVADEAPAVDLLHGGSVDLDDAVSASGDGHVTAATSDNEEDSTAINACKALLYAAANAVLFGTARLLHGTFTSY